MRDYNHYRDLLYDTGYFTVTGNNNSSFRDKVNIRANQTNKLNADQ